MQPDCIPPCPERMSEAGRYTWDLGDIEGEDRRWREHRFSLLPYLFRLPAAKVYRTLYRCQGRTSANLYLLNLTTGFDARTVKLALDEEAIRQYAEKRAKECSAVALSSKDERWVYSKLSVMTEGIGFRAPAVERNVTLPGAVKRLCDPQWWRCQVRSRYREEFEAIAIRLGMVHSRAGLYVSDESLKAYKARRLRNLELMESLEAVNELGQSYSLAQLVALSVSNPKNRRHELMARLYGFDVIAQNLAHAGLFITLTCPSRMHARYKRTGDENPNYDGTTPFEAQQYLCQLWARIRARLKHEEIHVYGFRVAEPQHDGTPHWHILLYTSKDNLQRIMGLCLDYALQDCPDEKGAKRRRCLFKIIDWNKGSGIGYISKYISKNIDGAHVDKDLHGKDAKESAVRVAAWASIHRIRQFQQFGGPPVTCWRELRRIADAPEGLLSEARKAADEGNWESFTMLFGGTEKNRKEQPIKLLKDFSDEAGRYGEPKGIQIVGVTDGRKEAVTRLHQWKISKKGKSASLPNAVRQGG